MFPALLLSILYVCLAAVLRVSQGGSVTVGVPPLTSTSGRQRLTKSSRPWRRTQSFNIADRRRLSIASYTCRLVRRAWPCSAPLLCARHCAKNTPVNTLPLHDVLGIYCASQYISTNLHPKFLPDQMDQLRYAPVDRRRGDTSTFGALCGLLVFMHCARLSHSPVDRSAPLGGAARGSAQRPNLVQL